MQKNSEKYDGMPSSVTLSLPLRFSWRMLLLGVICLSGAAGSVYLLYSDLMAEGKAGAGVPVAVVEHCEEDVWRKPGSSYLWSHVSDQSPLYRRDSVRAGTAGEATIRLKDGSLLQLGENSLVVMEDSAELSLEFIQGSFLWHRGDRDSAITIDASGNAVVRDYPVQLLTPDPFSRLFVGLAEGRHDVHFTWKASTSSKESAPLLPAEVSLEISHDPRFDPASTKKFPGLRLSEATFSTFLAPGLYFWRIAASGNQQSKALSEVRQLRVDHPLPFRLLWPVSGKRVWIDAEQSATGFRWSNGDKPIAGGEHQLEVAKDPQFHQLIKKVPIDGALDSDGGSATVAGLPEGALFWRIRSRYRNIELTSTTETFLLYPRGKFELSLDTPAEGGRVEALPEIQFNWWFSDPGADFIWELEPGGLQSRVTEPRAHWKQPQPGSYRWRVAARVKNQTVAETPWRPFTVIVPGPLVLEAPQPDAKIYYWTDPKAFSFVWHRDGFLSAKDVYRLEVARDSGFQQRVVVQNTPQTELTSRELKVGPGEYFWRVRTVTPEGQIQKTSGAAHFTYGVFPPLLAPVSSVPMPDGYVNLLETDQNPRLSWSAVEDAEAYEVWIRSRTKPIYHTVTKTTATRVPKLPAGKYQWRVRSIDRLERRGEAPPWRDFTAGFGDPLTAPRVLAPEVQ